MQMLINKHTRKHLCKKTNFYIFLQNFFLLKAIPSGVVNINYDIHACVHMGTQLQASETIYPPTAIRFVMKRGHSCNENVMSSTFCMPFSVLCFGVQGFDFGSLFILNVILAPPKKSEDD